MNYLQSVTYIESLIPGSFAPGLERFALFMKEYGNPQNSIPSFHVAGTNGKGSTVAMLDSVLTKSGFSCGRFVGPHLLHFNERFHVNGRAISDDEFARICTEVRERSEAFAARHSEHGQLSWFEVLAAMAFFHFVECRVDMQVLEVGLGGRWDATNVLSAPAACAIVSISLDHTHILGNSQEAIAAEKSGIIKPGVPVVTGAQGKALEVIRTRARDLGAPSITVALDGERPLVAVESAGACGDSLAQPITTLYQKSLPGLKNKGSYQDLNALVAVATIVAAGINSEHKTPFCPADAVSEGLRHYVWPGRFQLFKEYDLLCDGAHNSAGAEALRVSLDNAYPERRRVFVLSFYQNKDVLRSLKALLRPGDTVYAGQADVRRSVASSRDIAEAAVSMGCAAFAFPDIQKALEMALRQRQPGDLVVATGSFESVKAVFRHLKVDRIDDAVTSPGSFPPGSHLG